MDGASSLTTAWGGDILGWIKVFFFFFSGRKALLVGITVSLSGGLRYLLAAYIVDGSLSGDIYNSLNSHRTRVTYQKF